MALAPQGSARGRSSRHRQSQIARLPSSLLFLLAIAVSIPLIQASSLPASGLLSNRAQASTWKPAAFNPASGEAHLAGDFVCRSMGECEPCPASELATPACQLYGNRRLLSCLSLHAHPSPKSDPRVPPRPTVLESTTSHVEPPGRASHASAPLHINEADDNRGALDAAAILLHESEAQEVGFDRSLNQLGREDGGVPARGAGRTSLPDNVDVGSVLERRQGGMGKGNEVQTWEACAKVVKREREDFWEFVLCNSFFAVGALCVMVLRHRELAARQYGRLAARIGGA